MKPLLILFLVSIIAFNHCESNLPIIGKKKQAEDPIGDLFALCFQLELGSNYNKSNRIQDNGDGTISLVEVVAGGTCRFNAFGREFGRQEIVTPIYYIKKCIQGQVYRSAQNDCKGSGTAANYYSAQKFQRCPTNNTCLDSVSDAITSCANETLLGLKWRPDHFRNGSSIELIRNYFKSRADEILVASTDYYWNYLYTLSNVSGDTPPGTGFVIDSYNYVLCFQNQS